MAMKIKVFIGDDEFVADAYWHKGDFWNGWVVPYFDRASAQKVVDYVNSWGDPETKLKWDGETVVEYSLHDELDCRTFVREQVDGVDVWSIGGGSWTWERYDGPG
jgi:hypothetical protein